MNREKDLREALVARYHAGEDARTLGTEYDRHPNTIRKWAKDGRVVGSRPSKSVEKLLEDYPQAPRLLRELGFKLRWRP